MNNKSITGAVGNGGLENIALLVKSWGKVLDEPVLFEDGTTRFHVSDGTAQTGGPTVVVPNPGTQLLFADNFDTGKDAAWQDTMGGTVAQGGKLVGTGGETFTVVTGKSASNVVVDADFKLGIPFGIIVRYLDNGNFVLANYNPGAGIFYFHEKINGNWGGTMGVAATSPLSGTDAHETVTVNGSTITATISAGGSITATYTLTTLLGSGLFGVLTENTNQQIDNFTARLPYTPVDMLADAVQVIVPASASILTADLPHANDYISVTGIAGKGLSVGGNLRAVTLRKPTDLGPAN